MSLQAYKQRKQNYNKKTDELSDTEKEKSAMLAGLSNA